MNGSESWKVYKENIRVLASDKIINWSPIMIVSTIFVLFISLFSGIISTSPDKNIDPYLRPTLRALKFALEFLENEYKNVNLDAIIGTRIVEGQLKVLLQRIGQKYPDLKIPQDVLGEINELRLLAGQISDAAIPYIAARDTRYFLRIGYTLTKNFWDLDYDSKDVNADVQVWPYSNREAITEKNSDDCLTQFFGTGQKTGETCSISDKCWRQMTKMGYNGYSLTHEIFYLQIGKQFGCKKEMERKLKEYNQESIESLEDIFCTVILSEANKYSEDHFPHYKHDLFMEQAALCGMLGYRQFFNTPWLLAILSWQDPQYGCYRAASDEILLKEDGHRIKREERRLKNQCLSHRTTVAVAALGQYVRYILETWADNQKINHQ